MNKWTKIALERVPLLEEFLKNNPDPDGKTVKGMDIRILVAEPEWQSLRGSFVGTWKKTPQDNVIRLRDYVGPMTDPLRVRRVLNYLTGSAFRIGMINSTEIETLREEIRTVWEQLQN